MAKWRNKIYQISVTLLSLLPVFGGFFLLSCLFYFINYSQVNTDAVVCWGALFLLSLLMLGISALNFKIVGTTHIVIVKKCSEIQFDPLSFLVSIAFPLLSIDFWTNEGMLVALFFLCLLLKVSTVTGGVKLLAPGLSIMGYRLFLIELLCKEEVIDNVLVFGRGEIYPNDCINLTCDWNPEKLNYYRKA